MKRITQHGFTLYELLITLLIVGVVVGVGLPNLGGFLQNSRMSSTANDLHSSFHLARSEAARAKSNITVCASSNSMDTSPTCSGQFANGWIVFEDTNGDVAVDAGEPVLRRFPAAGDGITVTTPGAGNYFSYASNGMGRGNVGIGNAVSAIVMCDSRGNVPAPGGHSAARVLVVTPLGRAAVLRDIDQVDNQGGCP